MYPFYNRATGKVNWYGGEDDSDFDPNDAPDSLLLIPEFPEGNYRIMQDFIYESPYAFRDRETLEAAIEGKVAFRRFKTTVRRRGIEDAWYAYRDMRYRRAAREFCQEAGIDWVSTPFTLKTG